jgi:zinc dependent phospholipase C
MVPGLLEREEMRNRIRLAARGILILCVLCVPRVTSAYGVLSHEAIVDTAWESSIAPLLRAKFHASDAALTEARAFAYGGCLIQDLGYYPFSSRTFGNLTHYVRSGDFVTSLLNEASDVNEYAFALGALAHYAADNTGHPIGVNRAVPLIYPKLRKKYGSVVTYEDSRSAHLKTEFGLDVVQIARGNYLPTSYHSFIGFQIAKDVLERAFLATYGLQLKDVFANFDMAIGTFRYTISTMIPQMTKVAWQTKENEIREQMPAVSREQFLFAIPRSKFEQEWGTMYERPGIRSKILAVVLRVIPKVGPFSSLAFKLPTPEAERIYLDSFDKTAARYRGYLAALSKNASLSLQNLNFDTGEAVRPGEYRLADETQKRLMEKVRQQARQ